MSIQSVPTPWQATNLSRIRKRLEPIACRQTLEEVIQGEIQGIFIHKDGSQIAMYCFDNNTHKLSNIMSRMDIDYPLHLLGAYSQAVFLSVFWQNKTPGNVYIAGFGAGRLAMLFNHYFPQIALYGSDIDQNVLDVSCQYFGLDKNLLKHVKAQDSRKDLERFEAGIDILFLDVFVGGGEHVNHLSTVEFFELCKSKMSCEGVLVANLVVIDPLMQRKIAAIETVFDYCTLWEFNGAHVVFASQNRFDIDQMRERVARFMAREKPDSNYAEQAAMIKPLSCFSQDKPLYDAEA